MDGCKGEREEGKKRRKKRRKEEERVGDLTGSISPPDCWSGVIWKNDFDPRSKSVKRKKEESL